MCQRLAPPGTVNPTRASRSVVHPERSASQARSPRADAGCPGGTASALIRAVLSSRCRYGSACSAPARPDPRRGHRARRARAGPARPGSGPRHRRTRRGKGSRTSRSSRSSRRRTRGAGRSVEKALIGPPSLERTSQSDPSVTLSIRSQASVRSPVAVTRSGLPGLTSRSAATRVTACHPRWSSPGATGQPETPVRGPVLPRRRRLRGRRSAARERRAAPRSSGCHLERTQSARIGANPSSRLSASSPPAGFRSTARRTLPELSPTQLRPQK